MKKKLTSILLISQFLLTGFAGGTATEGNSGQSLTPEKGCYFPQSNWRTSTPEAQGMKSDLLVQMLKTVQIEKVPLHSVLIIRNGYLVLESYFDPYHQETWHNIYSSTKSITSTLVGIAMDEGKISGTDQKMTEIFPTLKMPDNQLNLESSTLENILTMTAGHTADSSDSIYGSTDWPQDFYNLPFSTKPGDAFLYDSGAAHLAACVVNQATQEDVGVYADKQLFAPLGISQYSWEKSTDGIQTGGWGIRMMPEDLARFGYLFLHKGVWNGQQIVSSQWVGRATEKHENGFWGDYMKNGYGYLWWMNDFGGFRADGYAGQYIYVMPEQDMVVVFTGGINYTEKYQPERLMTDFIIPSLTSNAALPENSQSVTELAALIQELENPTPDVIPALPEMADSINGKTFTLDAFINSFSLRFNNQNECTFTITQEGKTISLPVGMDDVYKVSKATQVGTLVWYPPYQSVALKGQWIGADTFILHWQYVGEPYQEEYKFTFYGDTATLEVSEYVVGFAGPMQPYAKYAAAMLE